jgi:transposase
MLVKEASLDGSAFVYGFVLSAFGAIDGGMSCRSAAARFGVAPSTAIRWQAQWRATGHFSPKPQGGDMHSRLIEERAQDTEARI